MNKKIKLFFLICFVSFGLFFYSDTFASLIYEENYDTVRSTAIMRSGLNVQKIATQVSSTVDYSVSSISYELQYSSGATSSSFYISVYKGGTIPGDGELVATSTNVSSGLLTGVSSWINFPFSDSFDVDSDVDYFYILNSTSLDNPRIQNYGSSNAQEWRYCPGCGGADWQDSGSENSIRIYSGNSISFVMPYDGYADIDFPNWEINFSRSTTSTFSYWQRFEIDYSRLSSSTFEYQDYGYIPNDVDGDTIVSKDEKLIYPPLSEPATWYARLRLYSDNTTSTIIYESDVIDFNIYYISPAMTSADFSTSTVGYTEDCSVYEFGLFSSTTVDAVMCRIKNSILDIFNSLFIPSENAFEFLQSEIASFKDVFPFSLKYQVEEIANNQIGSFVKSDYSLTIPVFGSTATILDSNTMINLFGSSFMDTWFLLIRAFIWVGSFIIVAKMVF